MPEFSFKEVAHEGQCSVCGKTADVVVCCSIFGAQSNAYCEFCYSMGLEPYSQMVDYVACVGEYPHSVNDLFVEEIQRILAELNISEAQFQQDVKKQILAEREFFKSVSKEIHNDTSEDF